MGRDLGKVEKHVLIILQTKSIPNDERAFLSTDEIICELSFNYKLWLLGLPPYESMFGDKPRSQKRLRQFEPLRISVYRALQSLERKGLIVTYFHRHSRWWAIPNRIKDRDDLITKEVQLKWVESDKEERKYRRECWKHGCRIRRLKKMVPELWVKFRFGLATEEEKEKVRALYESLKATPPEELTEP
jgi:hypothetical protein